VKAVGPFSDFLAVGCAHETSEEASDRIVGDFFKNFFYGEIGVFGAHEKPPVVEPIVYIAGCQNASRSN
jgi:hypothetical protein